ncbi:hypothetical protein MAUB1S_01511 [Mycolicibacterium aubagnense]
MVDKPTLKARTGSWLNSRGTRFWAIASATVAVSLLFIGSQIAHDRGQSVNWYTGFGQWLGALGSFIAAGVALWISVNDRHDRLSELRAEEQARARLVRVSAGWLPSRAAVEVRVENYGPLPVLDVELVAAEWSQHPQARWIALNTGQPNPPEYTFSPLLKPRQSNDDLFIEVLVLAVQFVDSDTNQPLATPNPRTPTLASRLTYRSTCRKLLSASDSPTPAEHSGKRQPTAQASADPVRIGPHRPESNNGTVYGVRRIGTHGEAPGVVG